MGMGEPSEPDNEDWRILPLAPSTPWRNFFVQHVALLQFLGSGFFFAASLGLDILAWSVGGDMSIAVPALFCAWICAVVGLALAPSISWLWKMVWMILSVFAFAIQGVVIYWHFHPAANAPIAQTVCNSISQSAPDWLHIAAKECGQKGLRWPQENPRINDYFSSLRDGKHHRQDVENDPASDWSSPFVEWALNQVGKSGPGNVDPLAWLKWDQKIDTPILGSIVVLNLEGLHHVGFAFRDDGDRIEVLGGNEHDMVAISDDAKSEVLGYRLPSEVPNLNIDQLMTEEVPDFAGDTDEKVKLSRGIFRRGPELVVLETRASSYAIGDFDNDGNQDIAATIDASGGGSGTFVYLVVFLNENGAPKYVTAKLLGDRVIVKKVSYANGVFKVDVITQGPDEPLCCPTLRQIVRFRLKNGSLVEVGD